MSDLFQSPLDRKRVNEPIAKLDQIRSHSVESTAPVLRSRLMCATEKVKRRGSVLKTCGSVGIANGAGDATEYSEVCRVHIISEAQIPRKRMEQVWLNK